MRPIQDFLAELNALDIKVWVEPNNNNPQTDLGQVRLRCNAPKGLLTPVLKEQLSARKPEIIAYLQQHSQTQLRSQSTTPGIEPSLLPVPRTSPIPLSFAQQRLWFLDRLDGASASYNLTSAFELEGNLNRAALEQSLQAIVQRHETLRTTFGVDGDGVPYQRITDGATVSLPVIDLQAKPARELDTQVKHHYQAEAQQTFDITQDRLIRFKLLQRSPTTHVFLVTMHHIVSDGLSFRVLWRELCQLYQEFCQGQASTLSPLTIQYADFAHWQQQWLTNQALKTQLNYWKQQLAGILPLLELPTDYPRPVRQTFRGREERFQFDYTLTQQLKALSQKAGVTLFMTLLAAFQVLLYRYSGQTDILVGSPIANRNRIEIEPLIGFFVDTLVFRADLSGNPSFKDLLDRVKRTALEAYTHKDLPFEKLVQELQPERCFDHHPVVQVVLEFQNAPSNDLELFDLNVEALRQEVTTTREFDIELHLWDSPKGLVGLCVYSTDLFKPETIQRMLGHFQTLLQGVVADSSQAIGELRMLTPTERQQLLVEWNQTQTDYPRNTCVHQLFEAQVQKTPDAVAVVLADQTLTYQQLNQKANQLAHYLQTLGVVSESLVGVCLERSLNLIIALLAILKAGGAYLPLDPTYPPERLAFMIEDAGVKVILTETGLGENLPQVEYFVNLNTYGKTIADHPFENVNAPARATSLVYVIYTSGSTGRPKGVSVTHRNLVRLVKNTNYAEFTSDDVVLQLTSISFDVAAWEIWGSLLNGSCLVLFPEPKPSLSTLEQVIRQYEVTILWLTAGLFHLMVDEGLEDLPSLRLLVAGGDALSRPHVLKCCQALPHCEVMNGYGPTENTGFTCCYSVPPGASFRQSVPIGPPIANTRVYILDSQQQPVPIGVLGELYTGGDGVARGYLNRRELNAERFISSPFNEGEILYKTGDKVRYLPDGNIEFIGRIDNQVKIRGFRIELSEIEAVISQHPQVQQSMVMVREDRPGDKYLVAYVKGSKQRASRSELRDFLQQKLPDYMVPNAIVRLDSFPLTPNGKVDRRALPIPDFEQERSTDFVAPRTPVETVIANIIATVLGQERVGIHDNFFALGGHSLLATQVISRIRQSFGVSLPLVVMFEQPTLADLAQAVEVAVKDNLVPLPAIEPIPRTEPLPLSFAQQRLWFLHQLEGASFSYNMFSAWKLEGNLERVALEGSLQAIVQRHESLRTIFKVDSNGVPYQYITDTVTVTLPVMELTGAEQDTEVKQLIQAEAQQSFDLTKDRLIRFKLLQLSPTDHVLLVTMHHIISDGWSIGVFRRELAQLYLAFCEGHTSPLAPLTIQYGDFAYWQRQWLAQQVLETQLDYWKQQLAGIPPRLELPTDYPRPTMQTFRGSWKSFQWDASLTQKLKALSQKAGVTLFMTLLAAFDVLLSRYSGQTDIVVGSPIANRNQGEIEPLIGFFVNTLVLRADLSNNPSFSDLLTQVRKTTLEAYTHQDLPFEKLVEELQPERSLDHHPVVQVTFALQNAPITDLALSGLKAEAIKLDTETIREFDLELHLFESERGLSGLCGYSRDLFKTETIERMLGHFQTLLQGVVADSSQAIGELPLLTPAEEQQILVEWNQTQQQQQLFREWDLTPSEIPEIPLILTLLEKRAQHNGDRIALEFQDWQLSYQVLHERANQLAHYLQTIGVGPEVIVGVCAERSPELVVIFLGILKAGGAYLPLDPAYPQERLAYMLADAQVSVLLTMGNLLTNLPSHQAQVVTLEGEADAIAAQPTTPPTIEIAPETLAYVIYTSGSTGRPKGVMVTHRGLGNLATSQIVIFDVKAESRILQFASMSFDASIWEMLMALGSGACLCLSTPESLLPGSALAKQLREQAITHATLPPSALAVLPLLALPDLQVLIVAGEACPVPLMQQWAKNRRFFNAYGPTEATVCATIAQCLPDDDRIPLGSPMANTEIYVLDAYGQPLPIGVPGELHIGGIGLARGYLNRLDLTQEKFVEIKGCEALTGKRLYKTGDRVRYRSDGSIEFLGRIDHQVKLRGFRIELGEVSATLEQHPAVQAAIALLREERPGEKHLVAYVIVQNEYCEISPTELREFLSGQLPNYMVPTAVVMLSEFPLTPNGKLDRQALPPPPIGQTRSQKLPKTEVEQKIVAIWQQILTVEVVGLDDNFFELGGHSLLLAQLQQQLQDCFGTDIPIVELFARPTVGTLAEFFSSPAVLSTGQPTKTESKQRKRQPVTKLRKRQQQITGRYHFRGDT